MTKLLHLLQTLTKSDSTPGGQLEKWLSGIGAALGLSVIYLVNAQVLMVDEPYLLIASMGASAVLLFAIPHSPLAQPYSLVAGHALSCAIGIFFSRNLSWPMAPAAAVGLAIISMYYLRCLHPPGGATALAAALGGDAGNPLGYEFIVTPIVIDALCLIGFAVVFNYFFPWRRYPIILTRAGARETAASDAIHHIGIDRADLYYALRHMDSFVDVDERDLEKIYALALEHARDANQPKVPAPTKTSGE